MKIQALTAIVFQSNIEQVYDPEICNNHFYTFRRIYHSTRLLINRTHMVFRGKISSLHRTISIECLISLVPNALYNLVIKCKFVRLQQRVYAEPFVQVPSIHIHFKIRVLSTSHLIPRGWQNLSRPTEIVLLRFSLEKLLCLFSSTIGFCSEKIISITSWI